jgi:hypothetical protein
LRRLSNSVYDGTSFKNSQRYFTGLLQSDADLSCLALLFHHRMDPPVRKVEYLLGPALVHNPRLFALDRTVDWDRSFHNPKNRLDKLSDESPAWHFMREDLLVSRFSIVPKFALGRPPLRVSICLQEGIDLDSSQWRPLQPDLETIVQGNGRRKSALAQHLMNCLHSWSMQVPDFEAKYMGLPFGSQIIIQELCSDPRRTVADFIPQYDLELEWLSIKALQKIWEFPPERLPPALDLSQLQLLDEPHDAISLVTVPGMHGGRVFVFKASVRSLRYLYHELKLLLAMDPHPNIIGGPLYLVTKKVNFGGKAGVCGMLLEYHAAGTMSHFLHSRVTTSTWVDMETRFRWAQQLASALLHIKNSPVAYYSDFKLDNILLTKNNGNWDAILIDFEQRGSWFSWSPPEINAVAHLVYLATRNGNDGPGPESSRYYKEFLESYLPAFNLIMRKKKCKYDGFSEGYNVAWISLSPQQREKALVFMFGKVLWCIFELQPTINSVTSLGADVFREVNPDHRFPEFRQTPPKLQELIRDCTAGALEWSGVTRPVCRVGTAIFPTQHQDGAPQSQALQEIKSWWAAHLEAAEAQVGQRFHAAPDFNLKISSQRPTIDDVFRSLIECQQQYLRT